ncbi:MAG: phosphoribosylglycinamide formyltransferase [Flavobacteriales bacterium]
MSSNKVRQRLAIFASGSGTNAEAMMERFFEHPQIEVALVVTNKSHAGVIQRAERFGVEWVLIERADFEDEEVVEAILEEYKIDWIVLAGWLLLIPEYLVKAYPNRIVNIHPALLPKFGGKGMYGARVHKAVAEAGEQYSGITIHYVNERFDEGKIIAQHAVTVANDDAAQIERKVRELELKHYPVEVEKLVLS